MGVKRSRSDSVSSSGDPASPFAREATAEVKIVHLDAESAVSETPAIMKCLLPPHEPLAFASFDEYDVHYQKTHLNRCSECHKNFPDNHFLHLHIAENHDPISAAKRDRGEKTYQCLVPTCDRLCSTVQKRRLHCIDKHNFPRNYDFFIINDGIDRRNSMLQPAHRRRSSTLNSANGVGTRRRSSTTGSGSAVRGGEAMDESNDYEEDDEDEEMGETKSQQQRAPIKLRGRGGFGRGKARSAGRGVGRGARAPTLAPAQPPSSTTKALVTDPMESLTSSISALQFIPPSVRLASGRGRGGRGQ